VPSGLYDIKDGTIKPWILGDKYGMKVICLNKDANKDLTSGFIDYKYMLADRVGHSVVTNNLIRVFIDGVQIKDSDVPLLTVDEAADIFMFELPHELFMTDDGSSNISFNGQNKVSVDTHGYLDVDGSYSGTPLTWLQRGMHIIKYVIEKTTGETYTDLTYDTETWSRYEDDNEYNLNVGLSYHKPTAGYKVIEDIANKSLFGKFIINAERKYTWDSDDFAGEGIESEFEKTKLSPGWFSGSAVSKSFDNIIPFFWVQYQKRDDEIEPSQYYDETFKDEAFSEYGISGGEDKIVFETNLVNEADAIRFASRVHEITDIPEIIVNVRINDWNVGTVKQSQEIDAGDFIRVELNGDGNNATDGYGKCIMKVLEVMPETGGVDPSENDWTVQIKGRIIKWDNEYVLTDDDGTNTLTDDSGQFELTGNLTTSVK
jgi:hypothetical protein